MCGCAGARCGWVDVRILLLLMAVLQVCGCAHTAAANGGAAFGLCCRVLVSHPQSLNRVADALLEATKSARCASHQHTV